MKEKLGVGREGPLLDFASRLITASHRDLDLNWPRPCLEQFGKLRPRHRKGFAQDPRANLQQTQGWSNPGHSSLTSLPWPCLVKPGVGPPLGLVSRGHSLVHSGAHHAPPSVPLSQSRGLISPLVSWTFPLQDSVCTGRAALCSHPGAFSIIRASTPRSPQQQEVEWWVGQVPCESASLGEGGLASLPIAPLIKMAKYKYERKQDKVIRKNTQPTKFCSFSLK